MVERPSGRKTTSKTGTAGKRAKPPVSTRKKWAKRIGATLIALVALGLVSLTAVVAIGYRTTTLPDPNADFQTATTFVYYNDGKSQLGSFAVQNRQPLTYDEMPDVIKQAVVSAENRDFFTDPGISMTGLARAAWLIVRGKDLQGGSTITQQYIKIMYLTSEQKFSRKFKELFLAYKLNKEKSKEEILESYLNTIYYGRGAYGIQAASKNYFDVDARDLTVPQAAVLATVINNPSIFDPSVDESNKERLLGRYRYVIQSMAETGAISPAKAVEYSKKLPKFPEIPTNQRYGGPKGFLLKMVEKELGDAGMPAGQISGGGLKITTTFDKSAQKAAVKSAQSNTKTAAKASDQKASDLHAAIASVDVKTGAVLALYGGPDYVKNSRNWATTARPTASTFKTYALAAGLKDGYSLQSTFNGNTFTPPGDGKPVRNEFHNQYGSYVSLLRSTALSINTAFVDLTGEMDDGAEKVMEAASAAGAPKGAGWDDNSRVALGTAEVSPLNQASAYATYGNGGKHVAPHVVEKVEDAQGKVIYEADPKETQAVSEDIAADVTHALTSVVDGGTGRVVQSLNRPIAGKTGTKDFEDQITSAWFVGYTKQVSTAVMYVAGDSGSENLDPFKRPGDDTFFGGTYPAMTWAEYMEVAVDGQDVESFPEPAWVNRDSAPRPTRTSRPQSTRPRTSEPNEPRETDEPSDQPDETSEPTDKPSETSEPTDKPTTQVPTDKPTSKPTTQPTNEPTTQPTQQPTTRPTQTKPTTQKPTQKPTSNPSNGGGGDEAGGNAGGGEAADDAAADAAQAPDGDG